jgi:hypothetical protein
MAWHLTIFLPYSHVYVVLCIVNKLSGKDTVLAISEELDYPRPVLTGSSEY